MKLMKNTSVIGIHIIVTCDDSCVTRQTKIYSEDDFKSHFFILESSITSQREQSVKKIDDKIMLPGRANRYTGGLLRVKVNKNNSLVDKKQQTVAE